MKKIYLRPIVEIEDCELDIMANPTANSTYINIMMEDSLQAARHQKKKAMRKNRHSPLMRTRKSFLSTIIEHYRNCNK